MSNCLLERRRRTAIRPSAAERNIDAQAKRPALRLRVVHIIQHCRREEWKIYQALRWIVENLRINEG